MPKRAKIALSIEVSNVVPYKNSVVLICSVFTTLMEYVLAIDSRNVSFKTSAVNAVMRDVFIVLARMVELKVSSSRTGVNTYRDMKSSVDLLLSSNAMYNFKTVNSLNWYKSTKFWESVSSATNKARPAA